MVIETADPPKLLPLAVATVAVKFVSPPSEDVSRRKSCLASSQSENGASSSLWRPPYPGAQSNCSSESELRVLGVHAQEQMAHN